MSSRSVQQQSSYLAAIEPIYDDIEFIVRSPGCRSCHDAQRTRRTCLSDDSPSHLIGERWSTGPSQGVQEP